MLQALKLKGVVFCQGCKFVSTGLLASAKPLPGAKVKLVCRSGFGCDSNFLISGFFKDSYGGSAACQGGFVMGQPWAGPFQLKHRRCGTGCKAWQLHGLFVVQVASGKFGRGFSKGRGIGIMHCSNRPKAWRALRGPRVQQTTSKRMQQDAIRLNTHLPLYYWCGYQEEMKILKIRMLMVLLQCPGLQRRLCWFIAPFHLIYLTFVLTRDSLEVIPTQGNAIQSTLSFLFFRSIVISYIAFINNGKGFSQVFFLS